MSKFINDLMDELELKGTFFDETCLSVCEAKAQHPDYQPGEVRIYTDAEIAEYMEKKYGL